MRCVLVVEDEAEIRFLLRELLVDAGYAVATAANGEEALDQMHEHRPDAVLLDLMMPVMDGWRFLEVCQPARM
ncbi:MAG TPA: response regulator [Chloroflexota bacterium]|nr:response regulator [Chloroflexota bacterium]